MKSTAGSHAAVITTEQLDHMYEQWQAVQRQYGEGHPLVNERMRALEREEAKYARQEGWTR